MTLPEQAACGMLDACETLEPGQIARLAHPHDEQAFDRTRQLLLGAIEAGDVLALGVVCELKAQERIKERPVNYAVTTLSEWSMRYEQHRRCAEMVLQRMRTFASMGGAPTLPPAPGEGWPPSVPWTNGPFPELVLRSVCACDPRRIAPERVLLTEHQLSQRDIPRDSLRNFIAGAPSLVQRQLFPQNSPLWQWLGQEPTHAAALHAAGANIKRTADQSPTQVAPALPAPGTNGRTRQTRIRTAVETADAVLRAKLGRQPRAREVFDHLVGDDETGCVVDSKFDLLIWEDSTGKLHDQSFKAMSNLLSGIRKGQ